MSEKENEIEEEEDEEEAEEDEDEEEDEEEEEEDEDEEEEEAEEDEEDEEEEVYLDHWSHEHPLTLVETSRSNYCFGCQRNFSSGEQGYGCSSKKCGYQGLLHEECAGLPRKIRHAVHPQHTLSLELDHHQFDLRCAICEWYMGMTCYRCTSVECEFRMHVKCAHGSGVMEAADDDDDEQRRSTIHHPSHPKHELRLFGNCSFMCDACGTTRRGKSYICTACRYWIHHGCASLPQTMEREDHHHSLSLAFHVPPRYIKFDYKCEVCSGYFLPKYWIYHCAICSYAVHIKCAFNKSPHATRRKNDDDKGIMEFPISDVGEEQIGAFVMRQGGNISIPSIPHDDVNYKFHNHKLRLVSSSSSHDHQNEDKEEDDDDEDYGKRSELICDGCITPIFSSSPSSSSSSDKCYYYMSCSECKYYLHMACFHLPPHLPSLPVHREDDHDLILQSRDKLDFPWHCNVCTLSMNGLFYACTKCGFTADVKCASLPDTIRHAAHPQHSLNFLREIDIQIGDDSFWNVCAAGCDAPFVSDWYSCDTCEFAVHVRCAMLPASVRGRRWDSHHLQLPLTYDANLNHPGEFYCDLCETEMNPKSWMYHCRHCDLSFHPRCFKTTSGYDRNIRFGNEYAIINAHPHPLTFQLLTTKRRCDLCGENRHEEQGFHCASCNFFICLYSCGREMLEDGDGHIQAVE